MNDHAIIRALENLYNAPLSEIAKLHPEEIEEDVEEFDSARFSSSLPLLPFTTDEANAAIARAVEAEYSQPRHSYVDDYHV